MGQKSRGSCATLSTDFRLTFFRKRPDPSWWGTEFINHEDFINQRIESILVWDRPFGHSAIAEECNHLGQNVILSGCESVSEFFHALSIPQIHHEWEKYVPVHELDYGCKKSSRACDSCTTGYNSTEILFTYWSNFANLNDNALRSFSSSVTITGWP